MKKKIVKILSSFIPSSKLRRKFRHSLLPQEYQAPETKYELHRRLYNVGEHSYMGQDIVIPNVKETKIGKYCSIACGVYIGASSHPLDFLTTHCFAYSKSAPSLYGDLITPKEFVVDISDTIYPPVNVGNDVWIGANALIMDGVTIGDGAVVGAGAVVTKDIPPYAVVGGVPAKVIKYRFNEQTIEQLLDLKWWNYPKDFITRMPFSDIKKCIEILKENEHLKD